MILATAGTVFVVGMLTAGLGGHRESLPLIITGFVLMVVSGSAMTLGAFV
jgi:hypothetical protein